MFSVKEEEEYRVVEEEEDSESLYIASSNCVYPRDVETFVNRIPINFPHLLSRIYLIVIH